MDTPIIPDGQTDSAEKGILRALGAMATPLLVFSSLLCGILFFSWLFILPRFTAVEVSGHKRTMRDIVQYRTQLLGDIQESEHTRLQHVLSVFDPRYDALKVSRSSTLGVGRLLAEVQAQADMVAPHGAVQIDSVAYDAANHSLTLIGDVHAVGSRSMTVLAAFADALRKSSSVTSLTPPAFTRDDDSVTGPHSPFTISLTFR